MGNTIFASTSKFDSCNMEKLKVGSLFAGIGGIDLGFIQAGYEIAWANEIDKYACMTYCYNFPDTVLLETDIRKVDFEKLEKVDVLAAGFPCQPFSVCGKKQGFSDARGNLFYEIMRAVDVIRPSVIFLENVANLTEHDNGRTFNIIHNEIMSRGYYIRYEVTDACRHGIPQHRTRTYIVAFNSLEACDNFKFPGEIPLQQKISDIIDFTSKAEDTLYLDHASDQYRRMDEYIRDSFQIYRFSDYGIQAGKDGISFTLKANMGTWKDRIPIIKDSYGIRKITPLECLALQGYPKSFGFPDIREAEKYKECGNSVVVPVVEEIAKSIAATVWA